MSRATGEHPNLVIRFSGFDAEDGDDALSLEQLRSYPTNSYFTDELTALRLNLSVGLSTAALRAKMHSDNTLGVDNPTSILSERLHGQDSDLDCENDREVVIKLLQRELKRNIYYFTEELRKREAPVSLDQEVDGEASAATVVEEDIVKIMDAELERLGVEDANTRLMFLRTIAQGTQAQEYIGGAVHELASVVAEDTLGSVVDNPQFGFRPATDRIKINAIKSGDSPLQAQVSIPVTANELDDRGNMLFQSGRIVQTDVGSLSLQIDFDVKTSQPTISKVELTLSNRGVITDIKAKIPADTRKALYSDDGERLTIYPVNSEEVAGFQVISRLKEQMLCSHYGVIQVAEVSVDDRKAYLNKINLDLDKYFAGEANFTTPDFTIAKQLLKEDDAREPEQRRFLTVEHDTEAKRLAAAIEYSHATSYGYRSDASAFNVKRKDLNGRLTAAQKFMFDTAMANGRGNDQRAWCLKVGDESKGFRPLQNQDGSEQAPCNDDIARAVNEFYNSLPDAFKAKGSEAEIKLWITEKYGSNFYPRLQTRVTFLQPAVTDNLVQVTPAPDVTRTMFFDAVSQSIIFKVKGSYNIREEAKQDYLVPVTLLTTLRFDHQAQLHEQQHGRVSVNPHELPNVIRDALEWDVETIVNNGEAEEMVIRHGLSVGQQPIEDGNWYRSPRDTDQYRSEAYRIAIDLKQALNGYLAQGRDASVLDRFRKKDSTKRGLGADRRERALMLSALADACIAQFNNDGEINAADAKAYLSSFYQVLDEHEQVDQHWYNRSDRFGDALRTALDSTNQRKAYRQEFAAANSPNYRFSALGSVRVANELSKLAERQRHKVTVQLRDDSELSYNSDAVFVHDLGARSKYEALLTDKVRVGRNLIDDAIDRFLRSEGAESAKAYKSLLTVLGDAEADSQLAAKVSGKQLYDYSRVAIYLCEIKNELNNPVDAITALNEKICRVRGAIANIGKLDSGIISQRINDDIEQLVKSKLNVVSNDNVAHFLNERFVEYIKSSDQDIVSLKYKELETLLINLDLTGIDNKIDISKYAAILVNVKQLLTKSFNPEHHESHELIKNTLDFAAQEVAEGRIDLAYKSVGNGLRPRTHSRTSSTSSQGGLSSNSLDAGDMNALPQDKRPGSENMSGPKPDIEALARLSVVTNTAPESEQVSPASAPPRLGTAAASKA